MLPRIRNKVAKGTKNPSPKEVAELAITVVNFAKEYIKSPSALVTCLSMAHGIVCGALEVAGFSEEVLQQSTELGASYANIYLKADTKDDTKTSPTNSGLVDVAGNDLTAAPSPLTDMHGNPL